MAKLLSFLYICNTMEKNYNDFSSWIKSVFPFKVQKISINAGFSCPNRDGRIGTNGCIYCNNKSFNPSYCQTSKSITQQLSEGKTFFKHKYPNMRYLAYFQSFTNTYAPIQTLKQKYEEAINDKDVVGIIIGTRPDCVSDNLLDYLETLSKQTFVLVEYGIETTNNKTLQDIHRGHTFECVQNIVRKTHKRNILTGGHIILGLPGEDKTENIKQAKDISSLELDILKIHQLQIIKDTPLYNLYKENPFPLPTIEEYIHLIGAYIQQLRPSLVLERFISQSPSDLLCAPKWGVKNYQFTNLLDNYLKNNHIYQGQKYV